MVLPNPKKLWNEEEKAEILADHCAHTVAMSVCVQTCTIADLFFHLSYGKYLISDLAKTSAVLLNRFQVVCLHC